MRLPIKLGLDWFTNKNGKRVMANRREVQDIADGLAIRETRKHRTGQQRIFGKSSGFQWHGQVWSGDEYHRISLAGQPVRVI